MRFVISGFILIISTPLVFAESAYPIGEAKAGAKVYKKCVTCHMIGDDAKHRIGPHLNGIVGRGVAALNDYKYSKGMNAYAKVQKVWTQETLDVYLAKPRQAVKGTRMAFVGLRKAKDRQNVIAYMKKASPKK